MLIDTESEAGVAILKAIRDGCVAALERGVDVLKQERDEHLYIIGMLDLVNWFDTNLKAITIEADEPVGYQVLEDEA